MAHEALTKEAQAMVLNGGAVMRLRDALDKHIDRLQMLTGRLASHNDTLFGPRPVVPIKDAQPDAGTSLADLINGATVRALLALEAEIERMDGHSEAGTPDTALKKLMPKPWPA